MKKLVSILAACGLLFALASCGGASVQEMTEADKPALLLYEELSGTELQVVNKETGLPYHFYKTKEGEVTHVIYSVDLEGGAYYRVEWCAGPEQEIRSLFHRDYIMENIRKSQLDTGDLFDQGLEVFYAGTSEEIYMKVTDGKVLYGVYAFGFLPDAAELAHAIEGKMKILK